jgi:hypothetical protein
MQISLNLAKHTLTLWEEFPPEKGQTGSPGRYDITFDLPNLCVLIEKLEAGRKQLEDLKPVRKGPTLAPGKH